MTDIVERLRARRVTRWVHAPGDTPKARGYSNDYECLEAAAEIERLRAECDALLVQVKQADERGAERGNPESARSATCTALPKVEGQTMTKPYPALCRNCLFSRPKPNSIWNLRCVHPIVNAKDVWALSEADPPGGSDCRVERERKWFAPCGMAGKLWEPAS